MFTKVLIANRGTIATRIIRTLRRMGIASVAVYSDADRHAQHVLLADEAVHIGPAPAAQSYLRGDAIIAAARQCGAQAIHPGYGFLSENPDFAQAVAEAGLIFVGPRPEHMRAFGLKHRARELAALAGVPLAPGSALLDGAEAAMAEAARIGYPVMIKSTGGGGGIGLQLCRSETQMPGLFERVSRLARNNFKDAGVYIEKYVERGRHIEVQIFGDGQGRVVALGERDCSAQRRNQKVVEETPAPGLQDAQRQALSATACALAASVNYENAGTVEFILDADTGAFYFLEVNTRLQVEHGVTEEVTGIDLVEWMLHQAAGELALPASVPPPCGHAIQVRLYAEDPARDFRPSSGLISHFAMPLDVRVESWVAAGSEVPPFYDPMLGKIIVHAATREAAIAQMLRALAAARVDGIETNLDYLRHLIGTDMFARGEVITRSLESLAFVSNSIEVISPGTQTTVQDYPGRLGYWDVGVPPSGPMDGLNFRLANRILGNPDDAAALEITLSGPSLRFATACEICLTGADMGASLNGEALAYYTPVHVPAGAVLTLGQATGAGMRGYLGVRGGIDVPLYLGSRATFTLGEFGGHAGRALRAGDVLHVGSIAADAPTPQPSAWQPALGQSWELAVLYGPHGAPDFFTDDDIAVFFSIEYEVHYNSNRTGLRLIGPKPGWARQDGGEAGLHPSNIHDTAYAIGAIDFTGDMPIILGPDGPSLGGFVCPAVIIAADLWKIGQLRAGDKIRFRRVCLSEAEALEAAQEEALASLLPAPSAPAAMPPADDALEWAAILADLPATAGRPRICYRRDGDRYLLVEYGELVLDLELRFRVQALLVHLQGLQHPGFIDLTPGVRSLHIHYDSRKLALRDLLQLLRAAEDALGTDESIGIPSRIVHMPLSWDDPESDRAVKKYMQSVRPGAPWCPSNIEFIRRINGLASADEVRDTVFSASYLVLGLGDVYLGAPVATPLDPRHRLVTSKYNPARTWTPQNAVGIGGAYMCIYGMEGPGGYQLVGRTCQIWNTYHHTAEFLPGKPWLLRFFDQVRYFPVSGESLAQFREDFLHGRAGLRIEPTVFRLSDYRRFLHAHAADIAAFRARQKAAFLAERRAWEESGQANYEDPASAPAMADDDALPDGAQAVSTAVPGSVWKLTATQGQRVSAGDVLLIVESMKMEIAVTAACDGEITDIRVREGHAVTPGQTLMVLQARAA